MWCFHLPLGSPADFMTISNWLTKDSTSSDSVITGNLGWVIWTVWGTIGWLAFSCSSICCCLSSCLSSLILSSLSLPSLSCSRLSSLFFLFLVYLPAHVSLALFFPRVVPFPVYHLPSSSQTSPSSFLSDSFP